MWHLIKERIPSLMRGRPGPSNATDPNPRLTAGLDRAFRMGPCAMPAGKASITHLSIQRAGALLAAFHRRVSLAA